MPRVRAGVMHSAVREPQGVFQMNSKEYISSSLIVPFVGARFIAPPEWDHHTWIAWGDSNTVSNSRSSRLRVPNRSFPPLPPIRLIKLVLAIWSAACQLLPATAAASGDDVAELEATDVLLPLLACMLQAALLPKPNIFAITGTILV